MSKRIYLTTGPQGSKITERLVNAHTAGGAINHAAKGHFTAKVASQEDLVRLLPAGTKVEESGADDSGQTDIEDADKTDIEDADKTNAT